MYPWRNWSKLQLKWQKHWMVLQQQQWWTMLDGISPETRILNQKCLISTVACNSFFHTYNNQRMWHINSIAMMHQPCTRVSLQLFLVCRGYTPLYTLSYSTLPSQQHAPSSPSISADNPATWRNFKSLKKPKAWLWSVPWPSRMMWSAKTKS